MFHDGHNKYEKFAQILTIIASILTIIASIFAILGLQVFKSTVIVPREVITPNVDSDKFDKQTDFFVEVKTRLADTDDKNWYHTIDAQVGEKVEFQIQYRNISKRTQEDVVIKDILPENMQYVEDSTILFNFNHPDGLDMLDEAEGIETGIQGICGIRSVFNLACRHPQRESKQSGHTLHAFPGHADSGIF